jgi:tetratricopeptide (TPR) repeat protein
MKLQFKIIQNQPDHLVDPLTRWVRRHPKIVIAFVIMNVLLIAFIYHVTRPIEQCGALYRSGMYKRALEKCAIAGYMGNPEGYFRAGMIYFYGKGGIKSDRDRAIKVLKLAAEGGNPHAMTLLAIIYISEYPEKRNAALELLKKAAELDDPMAKSELGRVYTFDYLVRKDLVHSYAWYTRAINSMKQQMDNDTEEYKILYDEADSERRKIAEQLSEVQLSEAKELAKIPF